jgi:hypothetical protein
MTHIPSSPSLYSVASTNKPPRNRPTTSYPTERGSILTLGHTSSMSPRRLEAHHEITLLDHRIVEQGETSSTIARLPHRIQKTKGKTSYEDRIEELTWNLEVQLEENDHLKRVNHELNCFREQVVVERQGVRNALHELSTKVTLSTRYQL